MQVYQSVMQLSLFQRSSTRLREKSSCSKCITINSMQWSHARTSVDMYIVLKSICRDFFQRS